MSGSPFKRTVLMGDPSFFSVQGGANPHTRTRWGRRRKVDRALAVAQWRNLKAVLEHMGIQVWVLPAVTLHPGLVYPANAGFLTKLDEEIPLSEKTFTLSNLLPSRAGERPFYEKLLSEKGFYLNSLDESLRFEGEADFFPAEDHHVFTFGNVEKQRFVPRLGIPPWKRVYGFRTHAEAAEPLAQLVSPRKVISCELVLEAHYHGDTALCAFGRGRSHLLAYRAALSQAAWDNLQAVFGERTILLEEDDARRYSANSFSYTKKEGESFLVLPGGTSQRLQDQIRERGVEPIAVDVSEFLKKGGGSVKCMIGDLGPVKVG